MKSEINYMKKVLYTDFPKAHICYTMGWKQPSPNPRLKKKQKD